SSPCWPSTSSVTGCGTLPTRTSDDDTGQEDHMTTDISPTPSEPEVAGPRPSSGGGARDAVLSIEGLKTWFHTDEGVVKAVDGVDIDVPRGRTMCLVGESGCGKSVTARSVLGLIDQPGRIEAGTVQWRETAGSEAVDLAALPRTGEQIRRIRGGQVGMVFQEPMASLSPMYTV